MQDILTVTELTSIIKKQLESRFNSISVKGEISNLKEQASGHIYFTLKDRDAQISAVLFKGSTREIARLPKNGDQVVLQGEINVYVPRGNYQIITRKLDYLGVGELLLKLHQMKAKFQEMGWFSAERKQKLPKFPRTIGIVTSPTGAVIQDIIHVLNRRVKGLNLILNPVKVQGDGAAAEIAKAIADFNEHGLADILIVGRGGGSLEDLWAFNEEAVVTAIYHSKIPVISAVGHETDFTLADFVADVRAPTPSAAAEIATTETAHHLKFLSQTQERLRSNLKTHLYHRRKELENFKRHPLLATPYAILGPHLQRVDDYRSDFSLCFKRKIQELKIKLIASERQACALKPSNQILIMKQKLISIQKNIQQRTTQLLLEKKQRLRQLSSHLTSIDPKNLLKNGYCILFQEKKDSVILSTRELTINQRVRLRLHDGEASLTIDEINQK